MSPTIKYVLVGGSVVLLAPVVLFAGLSIFSRRPATLGPVEGKLRACPGTPNCVCSCEQRTDFQIAPIPWGGSASEGLARLRTIIESLPRTTIVDARDDYLHAEFTSQIFRFVDDVEFLAVPEEKMIHVRSASRVGRSDLGVNRQRIEEIRRRFLDLSR